MGLVRVTGIEPARENPMDPKSIASASSAIPADLCGKSAVCGLDKNVPDKRNPAILYQPGRVFVNGEA